MNHHGLGISEQRLQALGETRPVAIHTTARAQPHCAEAWAVLGRQPGTVRRIQAHHTGAHTTGSQQGRHLADALRRAAGGRIE